MVPADYRFDEYHSTQYKLSLETIKLKIISCTMYGGYVFIISRLIQTVECRDPCDFWLDNMYVYMYNNK